MDREQREKIRREEWGPARKVGGGLKVIRGMFPSAKMNRDLQFEGLLERDCQRTWEVDPSVVAVWDQPVTIRYAYMRDGLGDIVLLEPGERLGLKGYVRTRYTPDDLVAYEDMLVSTEKWATVIIER